MKLLVPSSWITRRATALGLAVALVALGTGCKSKSSSSGTGGTDGGATSTGGTGGTGGGGSSGKGGTGGTGGSSGKGGSGGAAGAAAMCAANAGGPVSGDKDMHCIDSSGAEIKQTTTEAACSVVDAGPSMDDGGAEEMAATLFNSEGDDDDCKYHLKWTVSCVEENKDVTFNVTLTKKADGKPLTGAAPNLEVYLTDTHVAPNSKQVPKETAPGVYTAGPIQFDAPGKWTVRFHLRETCADIDPESPHGHVAFFVDVP